MHSWHVSLSSQNDPCRKRSTSFRREFKKLRRLMRQKRHIKIELCVRLSVLRLFQVGHCLQNKPRVLSFAWHHGFHTKAKNERFTAESSRCPQNLKIENIMSSFANYVKKLHQKACRTCSTIIFPRSTNQIIDLWRCLCRRHFLNS